MQSGTQSDMTQSVSKVTLVTQTVIENPQDSEGLSYKVLDTKLIERAGQTLKLKVLGKRMNHVTQTDKILNKRDKIMTQTDENSENVSQMVNKTVEKGDRGENVTQTNNFEPILEANKSPDHVTQTDEKKRCFWHKSVRNCV